MSAVDYLKDMRILVLVVVVIALALLDLHYGIHFGLEFAGGTSIPVQLEHAVSPSDMQVLLQNLQQRVSTFGLKQVVVESIGSTEVDVEIPNATAAEVNQTISVIQHQGKFQAVISGREALNGSDILQKSIDALPVQSVPGGAIWNVSYFISQSAVDKFAKAAFGQGNKPIYLFLDRPSSAILLINSSIVNSNHTLSGTSGIVSMMQEALSLGSATIPVVSVSPTNASVASAKGTLRSDAGRYRTVVASSNLDAGLIGYARSLNYTVKLESTANMTPTYETESGTNQSVQSWPAVGLLSAPYMAPSLANGSVGTSFYITGGTPSGLSKSQEIAYATNQSKLISTVLSGGALPVAVIPGTPATVPATLGIHSLYISGLAGVIAIVFVSVFIVARYRKAFLIIPILLTTLMELFIIVSIIGLIGNIDLAAVAGMIAVIGTGVDAQIIITDEIIGGQESQSSAKMLLGKSFYIVWMDALLLIVAMLPLFFSTALSTVIGFSESTIIGALLGVLITRPAYGAIVSRRFA
ncbi:MAG: hypothetical protein KGH98_00615 [Candidatus Micrarchaeota archaeon]|nr:hypothetical protein [Candidatus Micrarchaeota archaeon]